MILLTQISDVSEGKKCNIWLMWLPQKGLSCVVRVTACFSRMYFYKYLTVYQSLVKFNEVHTTWMMIRTQYHWWSIKNIFKKYYRVCLCYSVIKKCSRSNVYNTNYLHVKFLITKDFFFFLTWWWIMSKKFQKITLKEYLP